MVQEFQYPSRTGGMIHACRWLPEGQPRAVVQIIHGIAEYGARYDHFARFLSSQGILVTAVIIMHGTTAMAATQPNRVAALSRADTRLWASISAGKG